MITCAPASAHFLKKPSPNPEAPPVITIVFPATQVTSYGSLVSTGLDCRTISTRLFRFFAIMLAQGGLNVCEGNSDLAEGGGGLWKCQLSSASRINGVVGMIPFERGRASLCLIFASGRLVERTVAGASWGWECGGGHLRREPSLLRIHCTVLWNCGYWESGESFDLCFWWLLESCRVERRSVYIVNNTLLRSLI